MIVSLEHIWKSYGADLVLKDITLKIEDHDRIGLIGINGAGKSTLLNIINGDLDYDEGVRSVTNGVTIGFLRQNSGLDRASTILEEMRGVFAGVLQTGQEMERLHREMEALEDQGGARYQELADRYNRLVAAFEAGDGYLVDVKINTVLNGMGFAGRDRNTPIATLSGGEKTRLALCKLLLESPDLLILDEPTNHLDFKTLLWLEDYLKGYKGALMIVSHDRYFLDSLVTSVCELDRTDLTQYPGNYTKYLSLREEYYTRQLKLYEAQQAEIARLQDYVDRNIVRATSAKSAKSKRKAIEHMELVEKPKSPNKAAKISFTYEREPVKDVLHVEDLSVAVGRGERQKQLFSHLNLDMLRGEKIALIGQNGIGKSSLLKAVQGLVPTQGGKISWGRNVKISYYEQENTGLHDDKTVLDEVWDRYPRTYEHDIRTALGCVLFTGEDVYKKVESLSGGERAKLKFAIIMLEHANVLLFDEPTNHLDLATKEVLDQALTQFSGTLLMVSHDRYLLSKVPTKIIEMSDNGMTLYPGNYEAYRRAVAEQSPQPQTAQPREEPARSQPGANEYYRSKKERALQVQRRKKLAETEAEIARLEEDNAALQEQIADPEVAGDYQQLSELLARLEEQNARLEELYALWSDLQEED